MRRGRVGSDPRGGAWSQRTSLMGSLPSALAMRVIGLPMVDGGLVGVQHADEGREGGVGAEHPSARCICSKLITRVRAPFGTVPPLHNAACDSTQIEPAVH